jgi:acetoacetyl-CoA reductase
MGRVAIVTGGTRGIGHAIVKRLKEAGFAVAAGYAGNEAAAKATAEELGVMIVKGNVGNFDDCKRAVAEVEAKLGPIDTLVNNAGITRDAVLHRMTPEQWNEVIYVNLASIFNMCRHVIEGMRERNFGRIVNISSINGQKGQVGQTNYSASKAGAIGFTKALAQENAKKNITVNCICPGYIDTEMVQAVPPKVLEGIIAQIPIGRLGQGHEIASMVAYLASEEASYITGSVMTINGGQYIANG